MRTAKLTEPGKIVVYNESSKCVPAAGEAVVQVKACGICGTDMHIFAGHRSDVALPRVMGHELSGRVVEVGDGVNNVSEGDRVIFDPVMSCNACRICESGHGNVCPQVKCFGVQMDGGFQDYIVVPAKQLYRFPDRLSYVEAALSEPFSVAANILERANVASGEKLVVIGAGTIGLCILQAAKGLGCRVLMSDILDVKLESAKRFGADAAVNANKENLEEAIMAFAPEGVDVIIDAVGTAAQMEQSLRLARPLTRIVVIGFDEKPAKVSPVELTKKELTIIGSRMNAGKFPKVIQWLEEGVIDPSKMVERVFPVEEIQRAFDLAVSDSTLKKIIITFD